MQNSSRKRWCHRRQRGVRRRTPWGVHFLRPIVWYRRASWAVEAARQAQVISWHPRQNLQIKFTTCRSILSIKKWQKVAKKMTTSHKPLWPPKTVCHLGVRRRRHTSKTIIKRPSWGLMTFYLRRAPAMLTLAPTWKTWHFFRRNKSSHGKTKRQNISLMEVAWRNFWHVAQ